jgi:phytanoyl-CoA hydroxylase
MLTERQVAGFHEDGFLIIEEGFLSDAAVEALRRRFDALLAGEYQTGIAPDEVNWKEGRDPVDRTRQICNGWRADDTVLPSRR